MENSYVKTVLGALVVEFDYLSSLAIDEVIESASVSVAVFSGSDPDPAAILVGSPAIDGAEVTHTVDAGVLGVVYKLTCVADTSEGQTLVQSLYLAIVPPENV